MFASVRNRPQSVGLATDLPRKKIVAKRRTVVTFYVSYYKSVNSHRNRGVVVVKPKTVVTFGLVLRLRVSKVSTVTGIGGSWLRSPELSSLLDSSCVFASQQCQQSQGSGGSWSRSPELSSLLDQGSAGSWSRNSELSSLLKVSTVTGIGGVVVAKPRTVVTFGLVSSLRISKVSTVTGIGGVVVAKPRAVVTFGPGIGRVVVAKLRTVVTFKSVNSHRDRGGRGREAQDCRHFWTRLVSSHLKSVNSHRDRGGRGREAQSCRHFWTRDRPGRGRETQNCRHF